MPAATVGVPYCENINSVIGKLKLKSTGNENPDFRWQAKRKEFPNGLNFNSDGEICGRPEVTNAEQSYKINVQIYDANNSKADRLDLEIILDVRKAAVTIESAAAEENKGDEVRGKIKPQTAGNGETKNDTQPEPDDKKAQLADGLIAILSNKDSDKNAKIFAARTLGELGVVKSLDALTKKISDGDDDVKNAVNQALQNIIKSETRKTKKETSLRNGS